MTHPEHTHERGDEGRGRWENVVKLGVRKGMWAITGGKITEWAGMRGDEMEEEAIGDRFSRGKWVWYLYGEMF